MHFFVFVGGGDRQVLPRAETMIIDVTAIDIAVGRQKDCQLCPIALAAMRATNRKNIQVGLCTMWAGKYGKPGYHSWTLSDEAQDFILRFDHGLPVEPFQFEVR